ncbi:MAG: STAS domain-containing protein [Terriglobales bacterium]
MLHVTVEDMGHTVILHCVGRIVRGHENALVCAALRQPGGEVVIDLSKVDAIDAAGVGALVSLQAASIYLQLVNPTGIVGEVLRNTGLDSVFEIIDSQLSGALNPGADKEDSLQERPKVPLSGLVEAAS